MSGGKSRSAAERHTCRVSTVVAISVSSQSKTTTVSPSTSPASASALSAGSALTGEAGGEAGGVGGARLCSHGSVPPDRAATAAGASAASSGAIPRNSASRLTVEDGGVVDGADSAAAAVLALVRRSRPATGVHTETVSLVCAGISFGACCWAECAHALNVLLCRSHGF